jgi:hypothetical protein
MARSIAALQALRFVVPKDSRRAPPSTRKPSTVSTSREGEWAIVHSSREPLVIERRPPGLAWFVISDRPRPPLRDRITSVLPRDLARAVRTDGARTLHFCSSDTGGDQARRRHLASVSAGPSSNPPPRSRTTIPSVHSGQQPRSSAARGRPCFFSSLPMGFPIAASGKIGAEGDVSNSFNMQINHLC